MTDKQIMIDVTQCPYYREGKVCTYLPFESKCEGDCNWTSYKEMEEQLKRKEQECERLKSAFVRAECQIADDEILQCDMREAIEALKAENKHLNDLLNQALKELEKTRETLAEIKGLCQSMTDEFEEMDIEQQLCYCQQISKQILQKISEVEND